MPATILPGIGLNFKWALGESGWNTGMDANLAKINFLLHPSVISASVTAQPVTPASADAYIVPTGATGTEWSGQDGKIAVYYDSEWVFYSPVTGMKVWDESQEQYLTFETSWKLPGALYTEYADDAAAAAGTPAVPIGGVYINSTSKALVVRSV